MLNFINKLYQKKISSKGLGIFRICFSLVLLLEVNRIYRYKELYYDPIPFIESINFNYTLVLILWQISLVAIFLGFFTRLFAIINYIIAFILINDFGVYEYHMDYVYLGISFLFIFVPTEKSYSIDAIFKSQTSSKILTQKTSVLSYYSLVFVGIALVYFGSIFFKIRSNAWLNGLGIWLPCSLPQVTITNNQWVLNQEYFIKLIGYIALIFELFFIFLFFVKKFRLPLFIIGVIMHIGIAAVFPIPYFAFGYVALYLLLIPVSFWEKLHYNLKFYSVKNKIKSNLFLIIYFYYFKLLSFNLSSFLKLRFIKLFFILICILQLNAAVNISSDKITNVIKKNIKESDSYIVILKRTVKTIRNFSQELFGITGHGVFVDAHYIGFDKILTIKYKNEFLPLYDENGMPGNYLKSGIWANYNFRVNKPYVFNSENSQTNLKNGFVRYTSYWTRKNNLELDNLEFDILIKTVKANFNWEKDLLSKNLATPWETVGKIIWKDNKAKVVLEDVVNE
ncbi:HTTM domain-containing protein [Aurantibacter aestuarii]|uniref:HTTM-like domain-containing protein n=1 Tax=Aurantibacter aestuarii TaxID=1266046 RepID=A0A2T1N5J8_9FLAO|nr:HTTM domain-containing protein [Aurantibacter aestuarii]PSG86534.1 hypothetical protein C7H52_12685 [Aurantibacter aestuarii]